MAIRSPPLPRYLLHALGLFCFASLIILGTLIHSRLLFYSSYPYTDTSCPVKATWPLRCSPPHHASATAAVPESSSRRITNRTLPETKLSPTECRIEFADLFYEIDRSAAQHFKEGIISPAEIDISWKRNGVARVLLHYNKLYIVEARVDQKGHQLPRLLATLHQLNRAVMLSPSFLPSIEFTLTVDDIPDEHHDQHTIWAFSRHASLDKNIWLIPDFGYWSWPLQLVGEYEQIGLNMRDMEIEWEKKVPKALWRGAVKTNRKIRGDLMRVTRGKTWADVEEVTWKSGTDVTDGSAAIPITEHCKYQFLIQTEGRSYSGRGKYLLNCASVAIIHKPQWIEPHSHLYIPSGPHQNIVEVEDDFSDLEAKVEELLQNPERAKAIANNSVATFRDRYLTPGAEACYWRQLFLAWANVSFSPEPWEISTLGQKKVRGVPFETFVVSPVDQCSWWKAFTLQC